jgi:heme exporter protein B
MQVNGPLAGVIWAFKRDVRLAWRNRGDVALVPTFFFVVLMLFPLAIGAEKETLARIGPGVTWVAALLSSLLAAHRLFAADFADGTLEQIALLDAPLTSLAFGKIIAHWFTTGLPIVLLSPLAALQYGIAPALIPLLVVTLLLGTPILSALTATGAALTLGLRAGGALLGLLTLPLAAPVLIFGAGALAEAKAGLPVDAYLSLLGAGALIALIALPFAIAAALKLALD